MNMKWYWGKIALTALVIFCVGYGGITVVRAAKREVVRAVDTNVDVTIPLPFLPFNFDGARVGTFRKVVLHRSNPKTVESVDATVRLSDSSLLAKLRGCTVTVEDPSRLSDKSSFRCVVPDSLMTAFGSLMVSTMQNGEWARAAVIPLVLRLDVARRIQGHDAQSHGAELEAARFRALGDSVQALAALLRGASSDSIREAIESNMQSVEEEMANLRRSMSEAAAERTAEAPETGASVTITHGKVTVTAPDRIVTVGPAGVTVAPKPPELKKAPQEAKRPQQ